MRKGIVFTMDGTLALIIVVMAIAAIPMAMQAGEEKGNPMQVIGNIALDKANIDYYTGSTAESTEISNSAEFGQCAVYYTLDPDNSLSTQADITKKVVCEEVT